MKIKSFISLPPSRRFALWAWIGIALLVIASAITCYVLVKRYIIKSDLTSLAELAPLMIALGVIVALLTLLTNLQRQASEDYLKNANALLERAYTVLAKLDETGKPKNDRMNWIAAARFIRASEHLSVSITLDSHQQIYTENKEYWRGQLRDLIFPSTNGFPPDYYAASAENMIVWNDDVRGPLSEQSLAVLYRFIEWPEGLSDPIRHEPDFTEAEIHSMEMFGPRGLGRILRQVRNYVHNNGAQI